MTRRRFVLAAAFAAVALAPTYALGQSNTAELLDGAIHLYQNLQVERALTMLRQVVSPASPFEVTRAQRVEAYKYLGASLAILGKRDSAIVYFRAAIERDPFVELDERTFAPVERSVFGEARSMGFAIALRPIQATSIDPVSEAFTFTFVTTQAADVTLSVLDTDRGPTVSLLERRVDRVGEVRWSGVGTDGRLLAPGRYELLLTAVSSVTGQRDSSRVYFELLHDGPELEDTLASLRPDELLPEQRSRSAMARGLLNGLALATGAILLQGVLGNSELGDGRKTFAYTAAGAAAVAGLAASIEHRRHPEIGENVAENRRRAAERQAVNAGIAQRNAERRALTRLVIAPAAGIGQ
ncbi:MAG: tetratricopeptide repeat protein [Gemmatimonadaceae bacterium]